MSTVIGALACLEPNPNADGGTDSVGTDSAGSTSAGTDSAGTDSAGTDSAAGCDPCDFAMEVLEFETKMGGFVGTIPKPNQPHTVPIAVIHEYAQGNGDSVGYRIDWADLGDAWELTVELLDAGGNARVGGVAAVLGAAEAPEVQSFEVAAADACGSANVAELGGRWLLDVVEGYDPAGSAAFAYARTQTSNGAGADIEYCVAGADPGASVRVKVVTLATPIDASVVALADLPLDSASPQAADFAGLDPTATVAHLVGARSYDDATATNLGYLIDCDPTAPFACSFELSNFTAGASAAVGGAIVAVP